jgi:hypothetical protein
MQSTFDMMARTSGTNGGTAVGVSEIGWGPCELGGKIPAVAATADALAAEASPGQAMAEVQAEAKPRGKIDRQGFERETWGELADEPARVVALIQHRRFESALREVRALPSSLPQLPWLMGQLVLALAQVGKYDDTADLASEMLARFPLRPEVTRTLVALAAILAVRGRFRQVFRPLGEAVAHTYEFNGATLGEWAQRLAHQFRRHGNPEAAECILGTWGHVAVA